MQNQNIIIGLYTNPRVFLVLVITTSVLKVGQTIADGRKWLKKSLPKFSVVVCCLFCVLSLPKTWRNAKVGMFANARNQ